MKQKYQSELLKVCHQEAENLLAVGAISEAEMRKFDKDCLVPEPKAPKKARVEIRHNRAAACALPRET
jgi:DNA-binding transcriptional regulator YiaG